MNDQNQQDVMLPSVDASQMNAATQQGPVPMNPINVPTVAGVLNMASPQGQTMQAAIAASLPMEAHDLDLIEKTWVEKAKQIVARTHGDPYLQSKALSQVKADYIRKRYGKDVKVNE